MPIRIFPALRAVALALTAFGVVCADEAADDRLTVADLVAAARAHHPALRVADADAAVARAEADQAARWPDPELNLSAGVARARDGGGRATVGAVELRQPIDWPAQRRGRRGAAVAGSAASAARHALAALEVEAEVREAAHDLMHQREGVTLARESEAIVTRLVPLVAARVAAGENPRADLLRVQVEAERAAQATAERVNGADAAAARLRAATGLAIDGERPRLDDLHAHALDRGALIAATARHPRLALAESALRSAEARIGRADAARWPQAAVGGYLERGDDTDDAGLALSLTLPLWDGGRGEAAIARAALARARAELEVERAAVARDLEVAWLAYRAAGERAERLTGRIAPAAQEALRLAMRAYEAGETGLIDIVDVRRTAQEARAAAADAAHEVHGAAIHAQHAAGSFLADATTPGDQP